MKAVLSNRIHIEVNPVLLESLDRELTYKVPGKMPMDPDILIKNMRRVRSGLVTLPSGRLDLIPEDYEIHDMRVTAPIKFPKPLIELYDYQRQIFNSIDDSCILNAKPGWGKTFVGLYIACKLGQKTLIIVHNSNLREQWIEEVEKLLGFTPGIIGGGKFNDKPSIVIGNTQTLYNVISKISKKYGTIILDEMHHIPANSFSKILDNNCARYKIGLSGTLKRKDGKHVFFSDYFSKTVYKPLKDNVETPIVHIHKAPFIFPDGASTPWALRVNTLLYNEEYQKYISILASTYAAKGHKVLVVADRTEFLENCNILVGKRSVCITGKINDMAERKNLIESVKSINDILWGSISIFKEGLSINWLSCLIIGTAVNNEPMLEQLIGRITRKYPNKKIPTVVDIQLQGYTATKQAQQRMAFYLREGYKIRYF